jgi:hypothetical protein
METEKIGEEHNQADSQVAEERKLQEEAKHPNQLGTQFAGGPKNREHKMRRPEAGSQREAEETARRRETETVVAPEQ